MKKLIFVAVAALALTLTSCGADPESKAKDFSEQIVEATRAADFKKIVEISKEMDKYYKSLSDDEQQEFNEAMEKYTRENRKVIEDAAVMGLKSAAKGTVEGIDDAVNGLLDAASDDVDED